MILSFVLKQTRSLNCCLVRRSSLVWLMSRSLQLPSFREVWEPVIPFRGTFSIRHWSWGLVGSVPRCIDCLYFYLHFVATIMTLTAIVSIRIGSHLSVLTSSLSSLLRTPPPLGMYIRKYKVSTRKRPVKNGTQTINTCMHIRVRIFPFMNFGLWIEEIKDPSLLVFRSFGFLSSRVETV